MQKSQESFIVDVGLGSNYASGIGFTVENVHRIPIFILYGQNRLQKFIIAFLFLELIKNFLVYLVHVGGLYQKNPSQLTCSGNEWTSFYMIGTSAMNELTKKV